MADSGQSFRPVTYPADKKTYIPPILPTESNDDSSCNLSTSWIDVESTNTTEYEHDHEYETGGGDGCHNNNTIDSYDDENIRGDLSIVVDDLHFADGERNAYGEGSGTAISGEECHNSQQQQQQQQQHQHQPQQHMPGEREEEPTDVPKPEDIHGDKNKNPHQQPYVEIIDTHFETVEGYDWEGILDLRNRMKQQQQDQQEQQQVQERQGLTALRWVTEFRLYLTDGLLEEATKEASLALDDAPRYEIKNCSPSNGEESQGQSSIENEDDGDFVEFVESHQRTVEIGATTTTTTEESPDNSNNNNEEEGYTSLALSPLDVLTNSLLGSRAFHARQNLHQHHSLRLTELIVGGPSLELGEASIERLAQALAGGGGSSLKKLVLIVSSVDLPAMKALGECFRNDATSNMESLQDLHFYAGKTTERLVGSRSRYKNVPAPCVLGPGISSWVDAWTSNHPNNNNNNTTTSLRSLNLSRMDFGDEAAFALSRLLLSAPNLKVLNLAQDDFHGGCSKASHSQNSILRDNGENEITNHPRLSFAGTKRLLESLILIEDIKGRSQSLSSSSSTTPLPLSGSSLLELDLSGWVLEDDENEKSGESHDDDDDKAVDNFYDDYNYIDDGCGEDDFEFADVENSSINSSNNTNSINNNQRACCVIASMLRVNTTLQKLVLASEDGSDDTHTSGVSDTGAGAGGGSARGFLSFRSTLAIARALRDHVSVASKGKYQNHGNIDDGSNGGHHHHPHRRPPGSNLRTLFLSTNYTHGIIRSKHNNASSWAIKERKRAVAKVFYQALNSRSIHELRLQELSCTMAFRGLNPLDGGESLAKLTLSPPPNDLREQLEFCLQKNCAMNQSLKNIDSLWLPRLSSLDARSDSDSIDGDDDEDDDFHFVEMTEEHADPTIVAARHSYQGRKKSPPVLVLALPALLAKAGQEAASHDVVFSCTRIMATSTNLWEVATEHRCDPAFTNRTNRKFRGTCTD